MERYGTKTRIGNNMTDTVQNDVIRATAKLVNATSGAIQNVYWFKMTSDLSLEPDDVAEDLGEALELIYDGLITDMSEDTTFDSINYYNITQDFPLGDYDWPTLTDGTQTTEELPHGCAALLFARTGQPRVLGRKFLGPFLEASQSDGAWVTAFRTTLASALNSWITVLFEGTHATWQRGVWSATKEAFYTFVDGVVRFVVAYQRRRKANVGA